MSGRRLILLLFLGVAAFGGLMWGARALTRDDSRRYECQRRLETLARAALIYREKYGALPDARGPDFWKPIVADAGYPERKRARMGECPLSGKAYRGPAGAPGEWLGCCEPGTHGDFAVVATSDGGVRDVPAQDARLSGLAGSK
jgi:hypothetical protein